MTKNTSVTRKVLEVLLGIGQGIIEHSLVFPTALRKDLTIKAKPGDIKLSEGDYISARQIGYFHSFVTPPWPVLPTFAIIGMYCTAYNFDPQLPKYLMWAQIGLNVSSAVYETAKLVKKSNAKKYKESPKLKFLDREALS
jgi:hypothetical protein